MHTEAALAPIDYIILYGSYTRVLSFKTLNYGCQYILFLLFVYNYGSYVPTNLPLSCDTTPIHLPNRWQHRNRKFPLTVVGSHIINNPQWNANYEEKTRKLYQSRSDKTFSPPLLCACMGPKD